MLIEQLALQLEELKASATEDELAAERAANVTSVTGLTRQRGERSTIPEHLPRERIVIDPPAACGCGGGNRLRKMREDNHQDLGVDPAKGRVIQTVREKFTCRDCEKISQAPAPSM